MQLPAAHHVGPVARGSRQARWWSAAVSLPELGCSLQPLPGRPLQPHSERPPRQHPLWRLLVSQVIACRCQSQTATTRKHGRWSPHPASLGERRTDGRAPGTASHLRAPGPSCGQASWLCYQLQLGGPPRASAPRSWVLSKELLEFPVPLRKAQSPTWKPGWRACEVAAGDCFQPPSPGLHAGLGSSHLVLQLGSSSPPAGGRTRPGGWRSETGPSEACGLGCGKVPAGAVSPAAFPGRTGCVGWERWSERAPRPDLREEAAVGARGGIEV